MHATQRAFVPLILALLAFATLATGALAQSINTAARWDGQASIGTFGVVDTATYGQVVTAPGDLALDSFTFYINNVSTQDILCEARVYAWDGEKASGSPLFTGSPLTLAAGQGFLPLTVRTNHLPLSAGAQYVLLLTTSGLQAGRPKSFSDWGFLRKGTYSGGGFVFTNNADDPSLLTTDPWNIGYANGDLAFKAAFSPLDFSVSTQSTRGTAHAIVSGLVSLGSPAPAGGRVVSLSTDNALVIVPSSVTVPEGEYIAPFQVRVASVAAFNRAGLPADVTISADGGGRHAEQVFTALPADVTRSDAHVQDGAAANANFGTARTMLVSSDGNDGSGSNCTAFLRFKFAGFRSITKAKLRVYAGVSDGASVTAQLSGVTGNNWQQETVTFNTRPPLASPRTAFVVSGTAYRVYDIDVTNRLKTTLAAGSNVLSLALRLPGASASVVSVVSKETVLGQSLKPVLIISGD